MRKHRKHKGEGGFNVWRAYSDMMAGLLLLFVLIMCVTLFQAQKSYDDSIKERDDKLALQQQYTAEIENKQNTVDEQANQIQSQDELLASQQAALDELAAKLASQQATLDDQAAKLSEQESQLNTQSALLSQQQSDLDTKTAQLATQQAKIDNIIGVKADVIEALKEEFQKQNLNVDIDSQSGAMALDSSVMFDYNQAELTEEGQQVLSEVLPIYCQVLLKDECSDYLAEIIIDGYTDTSGDYSYNLELSQKRSLAVAQYLLSIEGDFLNSEERQLLHGPSDGERTFHEQSHSGCRWKCRYGCFQTCGSQVPPEG